MTTHELDAVAPALARWLAPYVAEHLAAQPTVEPSTRAPDYDDATCRAFVRELGDSVVARALKFFAALEDRGEVTSIELRELLGLPNQRSIGSNLTVSLSKRIKALDLPEPWAIGMTPDGARTIWRDRDGIAARMHQALRTESTRRGLAGIVQNGASQ
jgi:hypothetical protein